eukprot:6132001-Pleurochrysis_carterae.AAC.1
MYAVPRTLPLAHILHASSRARISTRVYTISRTCLSASSHILTRPRACFRNARAAGFSARAKACCIGACSCRAHLSDGPVARARQCGCLFRPSSSFSDFETRQSRVISCILQEILYEFYLSHPRIDETDDFEAVVNDESELQAEVCIAGTTRWGAMSRRGL